MTGKSACITRVVCIVDASVFYFLKELIHAATTRSIAFALVFPQILEVNASVTSYLVVRNLVRFEQANQVLAGHAKKICRSLGCEGFVLRQHYNRTTLLHLLHDMHQHFKNGLWKFHSVPLAINQRWTSPANKIRQFI